MAGFEGFSGRTFDFLAGLAANNEKAWFDAHREDYQAHLIDPARAFVSAMGPRLLRFAPGVHAEAKIGGSIFRINRDVRFSKDKRPYKTDLDLWFWHGEEKSWSTPGFFFRMNPERIVVGSGMHQLQPPLLDRFRRAVGDEKKGALLDAAIAKVKAADSRYEIGGSYYKKVPKGYPPDHPRAAILKHNGLFATLETKTPREARSASFVEWCAGHFEALSPVGNWLIKVLGK